jgi:hypothetical protein
MVSTLLVAALLVGQLAAGSRAQTFAASRLDGTEFRYDTSSTGHAAFYFWTPRDPLCREDMALLDSIQQRYAQFGLTTVTVLFPKQDVSLAGPVVAAYGSHLVNIQGTSAVTRLFNANQTPSFVLVGPHGLVDTSIIGGMPEDFDALLRPLSTGISDALLRESQQAEQDGNDSAAVRLSSEFIAMFSAPPGDSENLYKALYRKFFCLQRSWPEDVIDWSAAAQRLIDLFPRSQKASVARAYLLSIHVDDAYRQSQYAPLYSKAESLAHQSAVSAFQPKGAKYSLFARCWLRKLARENVVGRRLRDEFIRTYPNDPLVLELPVFPMGIMRWVGLAGNALVPGVGSTIAGGFSSRSETKGWAVFATVATYAAATAYVWDKRDYGSSAFLTPGDRNRRDMVLKIELGAVITSYAINLIAGFAAGKEYDDRH